MEKYKTNDEIKKEISELRSKVLIKLDEINEIQKEINDINTEIIGNEMVLINRHNRQKEQLEKVTEKNENE